jgi:hypothetical protein
MTPATFCADLTARGVEFQAHGNKLRFFPVDRLNTVDLENLRLHKVAILRLLRSGGIDHGNSVANPRPMTVCDRCGSPDYLDVPIHGGQSTRRDCARCHRFMGWPCWYGQTLDQKS